MPLTSPMFMRKLLGLHAKLSMAFKTASGFPGGVLCFTKSRTACSFWPGFSCVETALSEMSGVVGFDQLASQLACRGGPVGRPRYSLRAHRINLPIRSLTGAGRESIACASAGLCLTIFQRITTHAEISDGNHNAKQGRESFKEPLYVSKTRVLAQVKFR